MVDLRKHKNKSVVNFRALDKLILRQKLEVLTCVRLTLDLVHAISTLPAGFLWASKLKPWHVGLIGTVSSALGLYQMFAKKSLK